MNKIILIFSFLAIALTTQAQSPLTVGELQGNFGIGLDNEDGTPIYGGVDYGIAEDITVGGVAAFSGDYFSISALGNYHFDRLLVLPSQWNVYAGVNLGYYGDSDKNDGIDVDGFGLGAQVGGRYFFTDRWAANLEFAGGSQITGAKLGATYKLY